MHEPALDTLGRQPGTYALILSLARSRRLQIGRLGDFEFPAGIHIYVGSAFGPGGLAARLRRHINGGTRRRWHIDYLRQAARVSAVIASTRPTRCEHYWAAASLKIPAATCPVPGFGASDCRCPAHLFYFSGSCHGSSTEAVKATLRAFSPKGSPLHTIDLGDQAT